MTQEMDDKIAETVRAAGVSETEARFIIAIESGVIDGDMIDVTKLEDQSNDHLLHAA